MKQRLFIVFFLLFNLNIFAQMNTQAKSEYLQIFNGVFRHLNTEETERLLKEQKLKESPNEEGVFYLENGNIISLKSHQKQCMLVVSYEIYRNMFSKENTVYDPYNLNDAFNENFDEVNKQIGFYLNIDSQILNYSYESFSIIDNEMSNKDIYFKENVPLFPLFVAYLYKVLVKTHNASIILLREKNNDVCPCITVRGKTINDFDILMGEDYFSDIAFSLKGLYDYLLLSNKIGKR